MSDEGPWQDPQYLSPRQKEHMERIRAAKEGKSAPPKKEKEPGEKEEEVTAGAAAPAST